LFFKLLFLLNYVIEPSKRKGTIMKLRVEKISRFLKVFTLSLAISGMKSLSFAHAANIGIIADVEGDWRKIQSFAENSDVLKIHSDNPTHFDAELKADSKLVFLGDSIDKGPNNLKVLSFLLYLKNKYPDRVILIQGNRDANKLRFNWELAPAALALNQDESKLSLDRFRLSSWEGAFTKFISTEALAQVDGVHTAYEHGASTTNDGILKMKWMLKDTMGCPTTFQDLKSEMAPAPDSTVFGTFRGMVSPHGLLSNYLRQSQLAHLDEETSTLFVHGGVSLENFGIVPESRIGRGDAYKITDVRTWIAALNHWSQERIAQGLAGDFEGALPLIQYQEPQVVLNDAGKQTWGPPNGISIAQGRPWSETFHLDPYHPAGLSTGLIAHLKASGITKIFFGHSPVGQVPVMMRADDFIVVACDTSVTQPPRNATIEVSKEGIQITATYLRGSVPLKMIAHSSDGIIGNRGTRKTITLEDGTEKSTWIVGRLIEGEDHRKWPILEAYWTKAPFGPFGLPTYKEFSDL